MGKKKKFGTAVYMIDGCIVRKEVFYVATQLQDVDPEEYSHTRISTYAAQSKSSTHNWGYHDVNCNIVSVCFKQNGDRRLCALSKEGEVELFYPNTDTSVIEKIQDAGLRLGNLGYTTCIREIGESLFVCGQNNQVYQRKGNDEWVSLTIGPLRHNDDGNTFNSIAGFAGDDLYVVGDQGRAYHYNGHVWQQIELPVKAHLQSIRYYAKDEVWIGGYDGVLLKGNIKTGFTKVNNPINETFWSLAKFQDKIYLATTTDLYHYDGNTISKVQTNLKPEISTYCLDSNEEELWSFGALDITTFDGQVWQRVQHPDNQPI